MKITKSQARAVRAALSVFLVSLLIVVRFPSAVEAKPMPYTGITISGGEWYDPTKTPDPVYGRDFFYPTHAELKYFAGKGFNVVRFAFRWETLQPVAGKPFRSVEMERLKDVVRDANSLGMIVLLDPHNYGRYYGNVVGSSQVSDADFADFWSRLARPFKGNKRVWFGLVNEPHDMPTQQWVDAANAAIAAIRRTGATNLITVPGNAYTGAFSLNATWYGEPNGVAMLGITDPGNHYVIEVHQYLDKDSSGTTTVVMSPTIGVERLQDFTAWCRLHHKRAFLGEFSAPNTPEGQVAIANMIAYIESNRDVWIGFSWWAAGQRWGNYMFSLEPDNGQDKPQLAWLRPHLQPR